MLKTMWKIPRIVTAKELDEFEETKYPKNKLNYIGIEIECASKVKAFEMKQYFAAFDLHKFVNVGYDSSVDSRGEEDGYEIRVLVPENKLEEVIKKVCFVLNKCCEARVDKSCGLHVHIDTRNRKNWKKSLDNLVRTQNLLYSLVPDSRLGNSYVRPVNTLNMNETFVPTDHYHAINKTTFNTVEVRIHSGSLNPIKITTWIRLLLKAFKSRSKLESSDDINYHIDKLKLNEKEVGYIQKRLKEFKREKILTMSHINGSHQEDDEEDDDVNENYN